MITGIPRQEMLFLQEHIPQLDLNSVQQVDFIFKQADKYHDVYESAYEKANLQLFLKFAETSKSEAQAYKEMKKHLETQLDEALEKIAFYRALIKYLAYKMAKNTPHLSLVKK